MIPLRKALLIGPQCPRADFLEGVQSDLVNMKKFLHSPNGGLWMESEIVILYDLSLKAIREAIRQAVAEYTLVYLSGHGIIRKQKWDMLAVKDGELMVMECLNGSPKQLIIIDACRNFEKEGTAMGSIRWKVEPYSNFTGSQIRYWFDQAIRNSEPGQLIIHATQPNTSAYEDSYRLGGAFSIALLDSIMVFQNSGQEGFISIGDVIDNTRRILADRGSKQIPQMYTKGNFSIPFAYASPELIHPRQPIFRPAHQNYEAANIAAGILALVFIGVSISSKR